MADLKAIAKKWQERWRIARAFEPTIDRAKEKFFITTPYPYISGSLHIGHARVVTEADVYARFQRMRGKNVLYPIAFHISGTPVLGISTAIKQGDEKKIELYKGYVRPYLSSERDVERIVRTFEDPQQLVDFFIPKMQDEFSALGLSVDWTRSFTSGDVEHQKLVEWQFKQYEKRGYLVRGTYPVVYSLLYENAVAEDDIVDGDSRPVEKSEFTLIKFRYGPEIDGLPCYLVAATLRPETMYGQTNMWANPGTEYRLVEVSPKKGAGKENKNDKHEVWILSKECAEKLCYQEKTVETVGIVSGNELLGKTCHAPYVEREIPILPSKHCDPDIGTGLVTSVPSDAPYDWIALKELQESPDLCTRYGISHKDVAAIKVIPIITSKGYGDTPAVEICERMKITSLDQEEALEAATQEIYKLGFHTGIMRETCGPYKGMPAEKAKNAMKEALLSAGKADVFYETNRKAVDRSGGKIIVAILDNQWFLDFNATGWKEKARECLAGLKIQPEKYRKEFEDVFAWLDKRPCARRRGLGTALPQDPSWVIESLSDSTLYMSLYTIQSTIKKHKIAGDQLTDAFFDFVYLGKGKIEDVNRQTRIPVAQLEELRKQFDYWYPNDHRHTFVLHLANHLSFSIFAHAGILPREKWPKKYSFHGMVISEGEKMSKSKGNTVTLLEVKQKYGPDTFRAFLCSTTSVESTFSWNTSEVERMRIHLEGLADLLARIVEKRGEGAIVSGAGRAFLSRLERGIAKATTSLEAMELRSYANFALYELPNAYRKLYASVSREELLAINHHLAPRWARLLAPFTPHLAEEINESLGDKGFISLASWPHADEQKIDERIEQDEEFVTEIASNVRKVMNAKNIREPIRITLFVPEGWKYAFVRAFRAAFSATKNSRELLERIVEDREVATHRDEAGRLLQAIIKNMKLLPLIDRTQEEELALTSRAAAALKEEFGCDVVLADSSSADPKAKSGLPERPAIKVE